MSIQLHAVAKTLLPGFLYRRLWTGYQVRRLREAYFGRRWRALPAIAATGETHNFTYDLTSENLRYMAEMVAAAAAWPVAIFSRQYGRSFLMFKEQPKDHWYPGAGIGISFLAGKRTHA